MMLASLQRSEFEDHGVIRLAGAFSPAEAAAMQDVVWDELRRVHGVLRSDPTSWRSGRATGLQRITGSPVFTPLAGPSLCGAIDQVLGSGAWQVPKRWGAILATFPVTGGRWEVPIRVWHVDFSYALPPRPVPGVKIFMFLSDVPPRGGGTLVVSGSHRIVERFVREKPREKLEDTRRTRLAILASHPWLRDLTMESGSGNRVGVFMEWGARIDGVPVKVEELTGNAGDVVLTHPWLLHCEAPNCADGPRLMRTKDIYRDGVLATVSKPALDRS